MTTLSQLVDEIVLELKRPDFRSFAPSYANQTIREIHSQKSPHGLTLPILFASNRFEDEWTVTGNPSVWAIPAAARFQRLEAAYLVEYGIYLQERTPDRINREANSFQDRFYWYRTGANIAFGDRAGESLETKTIRLSWFEFPRQLKYYASGTAPATYDVETEEFTYHADYTGTPELQAEAQELTTNWVLTRWGESVVKQGVRAKIWARLGEDARAKMAYSSYESFREQLVSTEQWQQNAI